MPISLLTVSKYAIVRSALRHLLESSHRICVVGEAETPTQAEEAILQFHPTVVLFETVEDSTPEIAQFIEHARHAQVHVVVLANYAQPSFVRALFRAGLTGYVLKQSRDEELLVAVRSAAIGTRFLDSALIETLTFNTPDDMRTQPQGRGLTTREMQVLKSLVFGHTSGEIAKQLGISVKTVETYRSRIYEKLELDSRADLMAYAVSSGMISMSSSFE